MLGNPPLFIRRIRTLKPRHSTPQQHALEWLAQAHAKAAAKASGAVGAVGAADAETPGLDRMRALFRRFGCGPDRIGSRGHESGDFLHTDWERMEMFPLHADPKGAPLEERQKLFSRAAENAMDAFYANEHEAPAHLIHVTCTGYVSPSAAHRLVQKKGWQARTTVTHAYHMGCYAAIPALRIARGCEGRTDIVHTELCSIHLRPDAHDAEQCVVQSLFADGYARYEVSRGLDAGEAAFRIAALREEIIPGTGNCMGWNAGSNGFRMTLSREVPREIASALPGFFERMMRDAFENDAPALAGCVFAVHPGGPRIIDGVRELFGLTEAQVRASREVLKRHGNMSSATLPHVWDEILRDSAVPEGTPVISFAFGPGLTIAGAVFQKKSGLGARA